MVAAKSLHAFTAIRISPDEVNPKVFVINAQEKMSMMIIKTISLFENEKYLERGMTKSIAGES